MHDFLTHKNVVVAGISVGTAASDRQQQLGFELQAFANVVWHTGAAETSDFSLQQLVPW